MATRIKRENQESDILVRGDGNYIQPSEAKYIASAVHGTANELYCSDDQVKEELNGQLQESFSQNAEGGADMKEVETNPIVGQQEGSLSFLRTESKRPVEFSPSVLDITVEQANAFRNELKLPGRSKTFSGVEAVVNSLYAKKIEEMRTTGTAGHECLVITSSESAKHMLDSSDNMNRNAPDESGGVAQSLAADFASLIETEDSLKQETGADKLDTEHGNGNCLKAGSDNSKDEAETSRGSIFANVSTPEQLNFSLPDPNLKNVDQRDHKMIAQTGLVKESNTNNDLNSGLPPANIAGFKQPPDYFETTSILKDIETLDTCNNKATTENVRAIMEKIEIIDQGQRQVIEADQKPELSQSNGQGTFCNSHTDEKPCSQDAEVPVYLSLPHAIECKGVNCLSRECYIAKQFILHVSSCHRQSKGGCSICIAMDTMVCRHAKVCSIPLHESCPIPNCNKVKVKVLEQWMRLKVKHSELMQKVFEILIHSRVCNTSCSYGKCCKTMKRFTLHVTRCKKDGLCPTKKFLASLCLNHKDACSTENCPVDFCQKKIQERKKTEIVEVDGEKNNNVDPASKDNATVTVPANDVKEDQYGDKVNVIEGQEVGVNPVDNQDKISPVNKTKEEANKKDNRVKQSRLHSSMNEMLASTNSPSSYFTKDHLSNERNTTFCNEHSPSMPLYDNDSMHKMKMPAQKLHLGSEEWQQVNSSILQSMHEGSSRVSLEERPSVIQVAKKVQHTHECLEFAPKKSGGQYSLHPLWPDPSTSLHALSPTELQRFLKEDLSTHNQKQNLINEEFSEDVFLSASMLHGSKLHDTKSAQETCTDQICRKMLKVETSILMSPETAPEKVNSQKRHCARRLFPLDKNCDDS